MCNLQVSGNLRPTAGRAALRAGCRWLRVKLASHGKTAGKSRLARMKKRDCTCSESLQVQSRFLEQRFSAAACTP